ncbi:hypothetical protein D770_16720 [Flammeovirgaceae bacterium 311]|nr:hypothetical protein D770_16720 [Flammeovirgaceae bacterium 311]
MAANFEIPVLLVVFNRPDTALQVIRAIRKVKPSRLYIAADGPRVHKAGEAEICEETRQTVLNEIDWDCQVSTLFRETNMGCALGVSGAVTWFFEHEDMGIILEDDCLPSQSFFFFCEEMLKYHYHDERIMHISGSNSQLGHKRGDATYYFSRYAEVWGWATWKRAWKLFDFQMKDYNDFIANGFLRNNFSGAVEKRWKKNLDKVLSENPPSVWGYRWLYSTWKEGGLSITPNASLIKNIGFDERAVHTKSSDNVFSKIELEEISEIVHPKIMLPHLEADAFLTALRIHPPLMTRARLKMKHLLKTALAMF